MQFAVPVRAVGAEFVIMAHASGEKAMVAATVSAFDRSGVLVASAKFGPVRSNCFDPEFLGSRCFETWLEQRRFIGFAGVAHSIVRFEIVAVATACDEHRPTPQQILNACLTYPTTTARSANVDIRLNTLDFAPDPQFSLTSTLDSLQMSANVVDSKVDAIGTAFKGLGAHGAPDDAVTQGLSALRPSVDGVTSSLAAIDGDAAAISGHARTLRTDHAMLAASLTEIGNGVAAVSDADATLGAGQSVIAGTVNTFVAGLAAVETQVTALEQKLTQIRVLLDALSRGKK